MIAARLRTRAALHQVGALPNQRVSALVCVGVCVGVCAGTGRVCGAVELAGVRCVYECVCVVWVWVLRPFKGARDSDVREARRKDFNHLVFVF